MGGKGDICDTSNNKNTFFKKYKEENLMFSPGELVGYVLICMSAILVSTLLTPLWHNTFPSVS